MPRFYLHICNGTGFTEDEEGTDLADVEAARRKAIDGLRDIMATEMRRGEINMGSFIEIEDEQHQLVATIPFLEAVRVTAEAGQRPDRAPPPDEGAGEQ